ncbi:hypothetical protein L218DRAFT_957562, partial [Marasmius fiardii PR-910]
MALSLYLNFYALFICLFVHSLVVAKEAWCVWPSKERVIEFSKVRRSNRSDSAFIHGRERNKVRL